MLAYLFFFSGTLLLNQLLDRGEHGHIGIGPVRLLEVPSLALEGPLCLLGLGLGVGR